MKRTETSMNKVVSGLLVVLVVLAGALLGGAYGWGATVLNVPLGFCAGAAARALWEY